MSWKWEFLLVFSGSLKRFPGGKWEGWLDFLLFRDEPLSALCGVCSAIDATVGVGCNVYVGDWSKIGCGKCEGWTDFLLFTDESIFGLCGVCTGSGVRVIPCPNPIPIPNGGFFTLMFRHAEVAWQRRAIGLVESAAGPLFCFFGACVNVGSLGSASLALTMLVIRWLCLFGIVTWHFRFYVWKRGAGAGIFESLNWLLIIGQYFNIWNVSHSHFLSGEKGKTRETKETIKLREISEARRKRDEETGGSWRKDKGHKRDERRSQFSCTGCDAWSCCYDIVVPICYHTRTKISYVYPNIGIYVWYHCISQYWDIRMIS